MYLWELGDSSISITQFQWKLISSAFRHFKDLSSALHIFPPLQNTQISLDLLNTQIQLIVLPSNLITSLPFPKNGIISASPFQLIQVRDLFIISNGLPGMTHFAQTISSNKINISLLVNDHKRDALEKILSKSFQIDWEYIFQFKN